MAMQDGTDGVALDPEHLGQLVHRRPGPVAADQPLDLTAAELSG
jgi:hypothetical protein